jgi:hypothetical protein
MQDGDVLVGDRAFGSWTHFALVLQRNLHLVARQHQRRKPARRKDRKRKSHARRRRQAAAPTTRVVHTLGRNDQLVELDRPKQKPAWLSDEDFEQLPARITLRQVRYRVKTTRGRTSHVTLLTTLTDPRKDRYRYMTRPRDELRKALEINRVAA